VSATKRFPQENASRHERFGADCVQKFQFQKKYNAIAHISSIVCVSREMLSSNKDLSEVYTCIAAK